MAIHAATPVAKVFPKSGSLFASGPGGSRRLEPGNLLYGEDRIVTGGGNVQIMFIDNTKLVIGPNSALVIGERQADDRRSAPSGPPDEGS